MEHFKTPVVPVQNGKATCTVYVVPLHGDDCGLERKRRVKNSKDYFGCSKSIIRKGFVVSIF